LLLLPKRVQIGRVQYANENDAETLGKLLIAAGKIAKQSGLEDGYRLVINQGVRAQQSVNYLHIHMLSGRDVSFFEKILTCKVSLASWLINILLLPHHL
jgi:histidine triad (HIT) family protein